MTTPLSPQSNQPIRRRSKAWVYYAIIAVVALFAVGATNGGSLIVTAAAGLYSVYLYRGGRFVLWLW